MADSTGPDSTGDVMAPHDDPFQHFAAWWAEAVAGDPLPEAVHLSTANADGRPSGRVILVRSWSSRGFDLYTDLRSRKGEDFRARADVALTWHWKPLGRQVRVTGVLEFLGDDENDLYWRQRPRASQVSAWASEQSQEIASRTALDARHAEVEQRFAGVDEIPRPEYWGGVRVAPLTVEFWHHEDDRRHQRLEYVRDTLEGTWRSRILQP